MEKVNFGYSLKDILTPNERTYKLQLIKKIELFINKLRWKAIFFRNNSKETSESCASGSVYGLKSNKCPPQLKEKEVYHRLPQNAVTTTYKISNKKKTERKINCEGIKYAKEANVLDKVEVNGTVNCFITLKDH